MEESTEGIEEPGRVSDSQIISEVLGGASAGIAALVKRYGLEAFRHALRKLGDWHGAEKGRRRSDGATFGISLADTMESAIVGNGSPSDHIGIVARDNGIPAIFGASGASRAIGDGDLVRLDGKHGVAQVVSRRSPI